ncbi:J domain-containing protein DDB_G0295729 [Chironomus tepperi]|uniref:J domain-containing protein DDB_G0295729 n=1 Tax=Chironomus tepperi TaxID=113505 RepID=UPI00391F1C52
MTQGSNNSDQSSGYLSGSGGSSLPPNAHTLSTQNQYEFNYGETHFDTADNKSQNTVHPKHYSMASSLNEYPSSSNNEREVEFDVVQKPIGTPSSESSVTSQDIFSVSSYANSSTIDSSINYQKSREGRAKWGSYLFDSFAKDNNGRSSRNTNGPVWLEKSLSEARDSEEETMSISVHSVSSFLRGQNAPVDAYILAERESKRRKAMELQQAIKEQLEEREKIKRLERERQWQQEKLEEERLGRQMDMEKQRLEKERKIQNEKLENERRKEETMKKALEKAALEAQMERERKRREKALALQSSLDETISIQKIGERTEICIEGFQKPLTVDVSKETPVKDESSNKVKVMEREATPTKSINNDQSDNNNDDDNDDEDDGETILIGTPIKLKKKNLETFRRKFNKRQQNTDNDVKTSDEEMSTPKTIKSTESVNNETNTTKSTAKSISDLEGIAIVLQTMPLVPFVPLTNEMFGFNQLNNLALLMATQNRLGSPNVMLPIISRDISTPSSNEKLDLSQFIIPQNNPSTITLQIQQVDNTKQVILNDNNKITSIPPTPDVNNNGHPSYENSKSQEIQNESLTSTAQQVAHDNFKTSIPNTPPIQICSTPSIPHDGTFTKEESSFSCHDACTSTINENNCYTMKENEIKILTPQKYRITLPATTTNEASKTVATQTDSFLFCEFCSHQYHNILSHHRCSHSTIDNNNNNVTANSNSNNVHNDVNKPKEKKSGDRPKWGVRNPPIKYLKASERDPFYGKSRKKRYLKKAASESEKNDDSCTYKDCPLVQSPLLSRRCNKLQNRENLCSNLLPIKTDRFGRICLVDEQNFIMKEAMKRVPYYTSDTESSIDTKHRSLFLPKANDFKDIFVD